MTHLTKFTATDATTGENIASLYLDTSRVEAEVLTEALWDVEKAVDGSGGHVVCAKVARPVVHSCTTKEYDLGEVSTLLAEVEEETYHQDIAERADKGQHYEFLDTVIEHLDFCESYPRVDSTTAIFTVTILDILDK